jgi:hypothetical protein
MAEAGMPASRRVVVALLACCWLSACGDSTGPRPVGLMWVSGASGAFVGDTISLVVFYRDAAGDPIAFPRPTVTWRSSQPGVVSVVSESLAVALDTGRALLTAATAASPSYTVDVPFEVIPPWQGRLVWARTPPSGAQPALAVRELPNHQIRYLPDFGYPGEAKGDPYLTSDGSKVAAIAARPASAVANRTIYIVDLATDEVTAPFDSMSGHQISPVWMPGDSLIAFLSNRTGAWEVYTARPDGSGLLQRTQTGQFVPPFFDVTPESNLILPLRPPGGGAGDLYELTLAGDTVRRLTFTPDQEQEGFPTVSPDGSMIAFGSGSHVWIIGRDGSNPRRLLPSHRTIAATKPQPALSAVGSWTPDSRFVLLEWAFDPSLRSDGRLYDLLPELYAHRVADSLAIRLTRFPIIDAQPVFR